MKSQPDLVFIQDDFGTSAVYEAARAGWDDLVGILSQAGATPSPKDKDEKVPVYYAAENGNTKIISLLSKEKSISGSIPERSGSCDPPSRTERVFVGGDKGDPLALQEAFCDAAEARKRNVIREILKGDANLANSRKHGKSAMVSAIHGGHEKIRRMLLDAKACFSYPDQPDSSPSDQIPLRQAIKCSNNNIVAILLDSGANVGTRDDLSRTPFLRHSTAMVLTEQTYCYDRGEASLLVTTWEIPFCMKPPAGALFSALRSSLIKA